MGGLRGHTHPCTLIGLAFEINVLCAKRFGYLNCRKHTFFAGYGPKHTNMRRREYAC
ncbi:hypothetical protein ABIA45_000015 [Bradyrhizobium sp. USDA 336]